MEGEGFITLDETGVCENGSLNGSSSSKRKADESDLDCTVDSLHHRKKQCHTVSRSTDDGNDSEIIRILFKTSSIARKYAKEITDFICKLTEADIVTNTEKDGVPCLEFFKSNDENHDDIVCIQDGNDSTAGTLPQYDQVFDCAVGTSDSGKKTEEPKAKNMCFNCEGDHMMSECPEPKDRNRIAKNRREHQSKNPTYSRYHQETEQKFGHLRPGSLSAGLRDALGLAHREIPLHTYRMRVQGYPPGWLRAARVQRSNISVHHDPKPESSTGSKKNGADTEEVHYDFSRFIAFPGYNSGYSDRLIDNCRRMGFPPMSGRESLENMKKNLRHQTGRRSLQTDQSKPMDLPSTSRTDTASQDMDISADEEDPSAKSSNRGTAESSRSGSPSLETLEQQRQQLVNSLNAPEDGELPDEEEEEEEEEELVKAPPVASSTPQAPVLTPGASRRRELGTPLALAGGRLRYDAEKWAAGIAEHIPYENLPGATGAWQRMSGLVKKVRQQLVGKR